MGVLDRLPSERLVEQVRSIKQAGLEQKGAQLFGGDVLITDRVYSDNSYDLAYPPLPAGQNKLARVTFTPDDLTFGGSPVFRMYSLVIGTNGQVLGVAKHWRLRPEGNSQVWLIQIFGGYNHIAGYKFYFDAIGSGTFNATVIN